MTNGKLFMAMSNKSCNATFDFLLGNGETFFRS